MADKVKLRDKNSSFLSGARIIRALSQRRASTIAGTLQTRDSPEELMQKGIIKPEPIFGNILNQLPFDEKVGVPEFIVRSVRKVETMMNTEGLYRIPGKHNVWKLLKMSQFCPFKSVEIVVGHVECNFLGWFSNTVVAHPAETNSF